MEPNRSAATPCDKGGNFEGTLSAAASVKDAVATAGGPYAIRSIEGKGKGMVATQKITKGTRILSEAPIFRVPRNSPSIRTSERIVAEEVDRLGEDQRRAFFDLTNVHGDAFNQALGISRTNVLPFGS